MVSTSAERLKMISAPFNAKEELGGTGAHKSSLTSMPKHVSGVSNNRLLPKGTFWPQRRILVSACAEAGENQRCSALSLWLGR